MSNKEKEQIKEKYKKQIKSAIKDLKTPGRRHKQIPNLLTASRLLSPLLIIPAAIVGNTTFAAWSAVAFGLTDLVDGKLSGLLDAKSDLGADLDAFTDKIFAGTLLIGGTIFNPILLTNIALELGIAGINLKQKFSGKEASSTMMGKVKTWLVFGLGGLGLLAPALNVPATVITALSITTSILQGATIASYIKKYSNNTDDTSTKEESIEQPKNSLIEEPAPVLTQTKVKEKTEGQPANLEEFRKMSAFLHQEQKNQQQDQQETAKVYQKTQNNTKKED